MISRRNLLKWSALVPLPLLAGASQMRFVNVSEGLDGFVLDGRFAHPEMVMPTGPRSFRFEHDITPLWYETLDPLWRRPGFVLGGITGADTLFVLERLAWDRGRRVVSRKPLPQIQQRQQSGNGDSQSAISWVIAPVHPSVKV